MKKDEKQDKKRNGDEVKYGSMANEEIKKLAEDMYKGLIFTDRNIQSNEEIQTVFMPLALMGEELVGKLRKNPPGMIYEYLSEAGPMSINGMPMFLSFKMVSIDDAKKVFDLYHKIKEVVANA